nr:LysR family transcriptional regulator [Sedimentibacter sp.]
MNDRELIYVKTIADTKSISKAAKKLFIAQPSLSQAIQKIEEGLGIKLFVRTHDGMMLTLAGEKYYIAATEILNIYNDYQNEVTYINDLKRGRVTIGITGFMGTYLLPKLIPEFMSNFPNIEIHIKELNSTVLEQSLLDGTIDFAIMHKHPLNENKSISHDVLYRDPFLLATKKGHRLSEFKQNDENAVYPSIDIKLFEDERFILLEKNKRIRQVCDIIFNISGMNPNISLILNNYESARRLASTGFGITLIPMQYIKIFEGQYDADYYFIANNKYAFWDTCVSTNPNMYLSKASKVFIDLIHEYFKTNQPI